jgi:hypothetical protein
MSVDFPAPFAPKIPIFAPRYIPRFIFFISSFPFGVTLRTLDMLRIIFRVSVWYALPSFTSPGLLYFPPAGFAPAPPPPGAGFALAPPFRALFFPARVTVDAARALARARCRQPSSAPPPVANAARRDAHRAPRAVARGIVAVVVVAIARARVGRARSTRVATISVVTATRRVDARRRARGAIATRESRAHVDRASSRERRRRRRGGRARDARGRRGG